MVHVIKVLPGFTVDQNFESSGDEEPDKSNAEREVVEEYFDFTGMPRDIVDELWK